MGILNIYECPQCKNKITLPLEITEKDQEDRRLENDPREIQPGTDGKQGHHGSHLHAKRSLH